MRNNATKFLTTFWLYLNRFVLILLMALVSGLAALLPSLLHLLNRTIHEMSLLIRSCMPFLLAIVDMFNKAIGGLYLLVAMAFRGQGRQGQLANVKNAY
jgi:hypothetical protein